jgi:uncharacterized membrane protein
MIARTLRKVVESLILARVSDETTFSKARIEMLCDGVFAIAMTLLVLELKVPELPKATPAAEVWHALAENRLSYFAYVLTFMLAGSFWLQHHVLFHYLTRATRAMAMLNLVFLMFVSLLPFSTSLFARFGTHQVGVACYFGNQFILGLLLAAQWVLGDREKLLSGSPTDPKRLRFEAVLTAYPVLLGILFVVSIVKPSAAAPAAVPGLLAVMLIRRRAQKRAKVSEGARLSAKA